MRVDVGDGGGGGESDRDRDRQLSGSLSLDGFMPIEQYLLKYQDEYLYRQTHYSPSFFRFAGGVVLDGGGKWQTIS